MQNKLYEASRKGETLEVKRIQKMIIKSRAAKHKAVRIITQDNRGKKIKALSPTERLKLAEGLKLDNKSNPVNKSDGTSRPQGIRTIEDRAKQALVRMALEPEWEAKMEANSYGYRPGRSVHDAIIKLKLGLYRQPKYILDADISQCFDKISHESILRKLESPQIIKRQIKT